MAMGRVLAVDDDEDIRYVVRVNLGLADYEVIEAADGREGLEKAIREHPDLVILDVRMPALDGWEVLQALRADPETRGIPVIMLTVLSDDRYVARGWVLGADFYIGKPFQPPELVAVVTRLLEGQLACHSQA